MVPRHRVGRRCRAGHARPDDPGALTDDWPLSRLNSTLRAILRAGAWELAERRDVPVAVVVSEYVDIAKAFYTDEEPKLVNAVLDRLARGMRGGDGQARSAGGPKGRGG